jgi:hypothetical protein
MHISLVRSLSSAGSSQLRTEIAHEQIDDTNHGRDGDVEQRDPASQQQQRRSGRRENDRFAAMRKLLPSASLREVKEEGQTKGRREEEGRKEKEGRRQKDSPPLFQKLSHMIILTPTHQPQSSPSSPNTLFFGIRKPLIIITPR